MSTSNTQVFNYSVVVTRPAGTGAGTSRLSRSVGGQHVAEVRFSYPDTDLDHALDIARSIYPDMAYTLKGLPMPDEP